MRHAWKHIQVHAPTTLHVQLMIEREKESLLFAVAVCFHVFTALATLFYHYKNSVYKNHWGSLFLKIPANMGKVLIFWLPFIIRMIEQDKVMILSISSRVGVGQKFEKIDLEFKNNQGSYEIIQFLWGKCVYLNWNATVNRIVGK